MPAKKITIPQPVVKSRRFALIDGEYLTADGEVVITDFLLENQHEIFRKGGVVWPAKGSKVALCRCGCGKAVLAATLPDAWEDRETAKEFAEMQVRGHRLMLVPDEWVRQNWKDHPVPVQGSLF